MLNQKISKVTLKDFKSILKMQLSKKLHRKMFEVLQIPMEEKPVPVVV